MMFTTSVLEKISHLKSQKKMQTKNVNVGPLNNTIQPTQQQEVGGGAVALLRQAAEPPVAAQSSGLGDVSLPGAASFHTHSAKFPIEREVILNSGDKNCKIPILTEYMRKAKPGVAPDAPSKHLAWTTHHKPGEAGSGSQAVDHRLYKAEPMTLVDSAQATEPSPIRPPEQSAPVYATQEGVGPATSTPEGGEGGGRSGGGGGFPSRTYHSIKDMIAGRFTKEESLSPQSQLRQHGVYLASSSQDVRHGPPPQQVQVQGQGQGQLRQQGGYQPPQEGYQGGGGYRRPASYHQQQQQEKQEAAGAIPRYQLSQTPLGRHQGYPSPYLQKNPYEVHQQQQQLSYEVHQQQVFVQQTPKSHQEGYEMAVYAAGPPPHHQQPPHTPLYTPRPQQVYHHPPPPQQGGGQQQQQQQEEKQLYQHPRTPLLQVRQHSHQHQHHHHPQQQQQQQQAVVAVAAAKQPHQHQHQQQQQQEVAGAGAAAGDPEAHAQDENAANHQHQQQVVHHKTENEVTRSKVDLTKTANDEDDDEGGFVKTGGQTDSGRGSTVYSSGKAKTSPEPAPANGDSQWVDLVETELRNILRPDNNHSTLSESISSVSPPLPPLSPTQSSEDLNYKRKSMTYGSKSHSSAVWVARSGVKDRSSHHRPHPKPTPKSLHNVASSSLEIDSMLDENNSSDEDLEYTDVQTIRKQLEGLENMYSQVLKLLGVNKKSTGRYEASDPRVSKRRVHGSVSSLPSSVSSRPVRDKRRETRNKVRDIKGINKRFQRLESHVVTLARSVAHLSSEMRTQHLMMQEMEVMRGELASLRVQAATRARLATPPAPAAPNSTPEKVKKLTKFFGDEPPLLRIFLKKLGYEKYASLFEKERIGLVELPYMTEERLVRLGVPLGPRLRIMQQAQLAFTQSPNTLCIV